MKKELTIEEKIEMVNRYTVSGVPGNSLKRMCRDAKISYPKLMKELCGQTCGLVGNESLIYPCDIIRFINKSKIWD